jgi:triose/dihydroxyacetone kinase / FAD-AMP lyase (cyclizing)
MDSSPPPPPPPSSKCLFNAPPSSAVLESIDGYLLTRPDLVRLDGFPGTKVVALRDAVARPPLVAVISGGGAGHEPAHCGLVAAGLLTAAVSGDVFASPHPDAILAAIRTVARRGGGADDDDDDGGGGVLLVVKNYTGDRLAFGAAAETARAEGYSVELVIVGDDAAVDGGAITGRRGLAGTLLVHKVAGAAAAEGLQLGAVAALARATAAAVLTAGASLSVCSLPGVPLSTRLAAGDGSCEVGLGIHGEPGAELVALLSADALAERLVDLLQRRHGQTAAAAGTGAGSGADSGASPCVLLVNNLGGLSALEFGIVVGSVVKAMRGGAISFSAPGRTLVPTHILTGSLMTSLDMKGVSVTVLEAEQSLALALASSTSSSSPPLPSLLGLLRAPTSCPHWPPLVLLPDVGSRMHVVPVPRAPPPSTSAAAQASQEGGGELVRGDVASFLAAVRAAAAAATAAEPELARLDTLAGDGDAGLTMRLIAGAALRGAEEAAASAAGGSPTTAPLANLLGGVADAVSGAAGGSSGLLYGIMLRAAQAQARALGPATPVPEAVALCFHAGVAAAQTYGGAHAGDRTMLDALFPASTALSAGRGWAAAAAAAEEGAEATKWMAPKAGRASYVAAERCKGERDAGAHAVAAWMRAVAEGVGAGRGE